MNKYQNASFWIRFLSDIINLGFFFGFETAAYYVFNLFANPWVGFGLLLCFTLFLLIFNYLCLPLITNFGNLGMIVTRIRFLSEKKNKSILKRNIFTSFLWCLILIITCCVMLPYHNLMDHNGKMDLKKLPLFVNIIVYIISAIMTFWFLLMFLNYVVILVRAKRRSIIDFLSDQRVVYNKQVTAQDDQYILLPLKITHEQLNWKE
ncbi:Uncharacterised protein [Mycoplasmopsis californica]|uniref:RDD family protein n=1 Tax=Mycoplasmopsis equigenitalium TaxID=114883 RepID=A0ABY5J0F9_9BACT|nr:RDD family protein [Mycoplasmopsis equigenitalium]UUD36747.1 RDD family protein [Mycoplasmopsis equigenitalium]VEU69959.1 Uncharacterised protein [Mycoplasmopsis californica]